MAQCVLITGASAGFGEASARLFAAKGWNIVLVARRTEKLEKLKEELGSTRCMVITCDVQNREQVMSTMSQLPEGFNEVDVLINSAGLALGLKGAHEADLDDWETMVDTNIKGLMYVTRALLPSMVKRNKGHIINLGSIAGNWPYPGGNVYGASKAFVKQFSFNLRADLIKTQVKVTNIEPGLAETEFSIVRNHGDKEKADKIYRGTEPLTAEDIAQSILWVVEAPSHVNINSVEIMPVCQAWGGFAINRS